MRGRWHGTYTAWTCHSQLATAESLKTGGRLIRHARYFILQLAESHLTPTLFRQILGRIERLAWHPT